MWISWVAPADGIATFNTAGSTFDTLLGIYTGGDLGNLTTDTASSAKSLYRGATVGVRKRFSNRFQLEANYVWSEDLDDDHAPCQQNHWYQNQIIGTDLLRSRRRDYPAQSASK